jgi:hypothetical protein
MIRNALSLVLASVSLLVSASSGCGTVVRNPGGDDDDAEKETPSSRAPTPVPPSESQENDGKGTSTGSVQAPDCKGTLVQPEPGSMAAADAFAVEMERGLTLDVTIFQGTPSGDVTSNYGFSLLEPKGNRREAKPFPLSLEGAFVLTVLNEKIPVCQNLVSVSPEDLARGGAWRLQITLPTVP